MRATSKIGSMDFAQAFGMLFVLIFLILLLCYSDGEVSMLIHISIFFISTRIFAPTAYIFFASALPVIAFGEQLSRDTGTAFVFSLR